MRVSLSDQELLNLTEEQIREIVPAGDPTTVWLFLRLQALARGKANTPPSPSTPSSQIPPYKKPNADHKKRRGKRPGRKKGHKGSRRSKPPHIDATVEHVLKACPDCGGAVSGKKYGTTSRIIEDIRQTTAEVVRHIIHTHYCPQCKKHVRPKVDAALPKSTLGLRTVLLGSLSTAPNTPIPIAAVWPNGYDAMRGQCSSSCQRTVIMSPFPHSRNVT